MTSAHGTTEESRLQALYRYDVLDTPPEESFDRITRLAKGVMQTPIVLVSLIDSERQWFKSRQGLDVSETPREISFCAHAIQHDTPMIVQDAQSDIRFRDNPLVMGGPMIRFYIGVPLRTPEGENIGTLCAIDRQPRNPSPDQMALLQDLARLVVDELELRQIAMTDSLTGTMTRRGFMREASQALELARRYRHALSCIMIDVDHFKSVNDRYGHAIGDRVLRGIAASCRQVIRTVDSLGRLGGEEFAIILPETELAAAKVVAERLRQQIEEATIPTDSGTIKVTASLGVAVASSECRDVDTLLRDADDALYEAKSGGRNRVVAAG